MGDLALFLIIVSIVAVVGVGFGIVVLAPRIGRLLDRSDEPEDAGDRPA
jgi:hypothetical protein